LRAGFKELTQTLTESQGTSHRREEGGGEAVGEIWRGGKTPRSPGINGIDGGGGSATV